MAPKTLADMIPILERAKRPHGPERLARIIVGAEDGRFRWKAEDGLPLPGLDDDAAGFGTWASAMAHATVVGFVVIAGEGRYRVGQYLEVSAAPPSDLAGQTPEPTWPDPVEEAIAAARRHGEASEPEHETGDLQEMLRAAVRLMTPLQRKRWAADPAVYDVTETWAI